jgi:hypothetical protein
MTADDRKNLAKAYMGVAAFYSDRPVLRETVTMWLNALEDLEPSKIHEALKKWFNDPKASRPPTPGQIRELITPTVDEQTEAIDIASRIIAAVPKYGYQGSANVRDARAFIGESGWVAVDRLGGWRYICENLGTRTLPLTMAQAQIRDVCRAQVVLAKSGRVFLPAPGEKIELGEAKEVMKLIDSKTNTPKEGE